MGTVADEDEAVAEGKRQCVVMIARQHHLLRTGDALHQAFAFGPVAAHAGLPAVQPGFAPGREILRPEAPEEGRLRFRLLVLERRLSSELKERGLHTLLYGTRVLQVAARVVSKHALNVMAGHDDVYALLASGYTVLFGSNPQEAADLAAISYRASALSLIPVANAMDGFSTSHMLSEALMISGPMPSP